LLFFIDLWSDTALGSPDLNAVTQPMHVTAHVAGHASREKEHLYRCVRAATATVRGNELRHPTAVSEFRSTGVDAAWLAQAQEERARAAAPGQKRPGQS